MGGPGSGNTYNNYRIPLMLTREMRASLIKTMAAENSSDDFPIVLRMMRIGLIKTGFMGTQEIQSMYYRKNDRGQSLIDDNEIDFLIKEGLVQDFRVKVLTHEDKQKLDRVNELERIYVGRIQLWDKIRPEQRLKWYNDAKTHRDISTNAKKLIELAEKEETTTN